MIMAEKAAKEKVAKKEAPKAAKAPVKEVKTEAKPEVKAGKKDAKQIEAEMRGLEILKYPLITEKAVNMIDDGNKLTFVVKNNATKTQVRSAVEQVYKVKVTKINMLRDLKARKKAIVTLDKKFKAGDTATKLGVV